EALAWDKVDVVGVGDSYIDISHKEVFDLFKAEGVKYHALGLFGYGPPQYNILMKEFGGSLAPKLYVYSTYLGNDPGDVLRYEQWRASGEEWFAHNGGYVFPIERRGFVWGWRLFISRSKGYARGLISRVNPDSYASLRTLMKRDDAEAIFEYALEAKKLASE